ncbi:hypothetical protein C8J56DRAFT_901261 [Mycena floridula]|nr:hypothetical protein C8J56DRAFT_901261 [Mycena floridula]
MACGRDPTKVVQKLRQWMEDNYQFHGFLHYVKRANNEADVSVSAVNPKGCWQTWHGTGRKTWISALPKQLKLSNCDTEETCYTSLSKVKSWCRSRVGLGACETQWLGLRTKKPPTRTRPQKKPSIRRCPLTPLLTRHPAPRASGTIFAIRNCTATSYAPSVRDQDDLVRHNAPIAQVASQQGHTAGAYLGRPFKGIVRREAFEARANKTSLGQGSEAAKEVNSEATGNSEKSETSGDIANSDSTEDMEKQLAKSWGFWFSKLGFSDRSPLAASSHTYFGAPRTPPPSFRSHQQIAIHLSAFCVFLLVTSGKVTSAKSGLWYYAPSGPDVGDE